MLTRRSLLASTIAVPLAAQTKPELKLKWRDARTLSVEGQGWKDTEAPYDRLPAKAKALVRPEVWNLSRHAAGIAVRFRANTTAIHGRWTLGIEKLESVTMAAVAQSGLDLYARDDAGKMRWLGIGRPTKFPKSEAVLIADIKPGWRDFVVYLPLFNSVLELEIGVPEGAEIAVATPRPAGRQLPITFYGTSITHAHGASRPGMAHVSILGRRLDRPVINLGFGGNGRLEMEMAKLLTEIESAVYVIDCLPNVVAAQVAERTEPLVKELRRVRPDTPILLVEDRSYQDSFLVESKHKRNVESRAAFEAAYESLKQQKVGGLYYLKGEDLLGSDGEATVDSSHPSDLGYMRQADAFEAALRPILK